MSCEEVGVAVGTGRSVRAAVVALPGSKFELKTLSLEPPQADEVLVRVVSAGVCHTDAVARAGDYPVPTPVVLGHEGAGVVVAVGDEVTDIAVDDHVVMSFVACGRCSTCRAGRPALCQYALECNFSAQRADGSTCLTTEDDAPVHSHFFGQSSFATYALAPAASTVVIDKDFDLRLAGPLGCGFQTGAGAVFNSLRPDPGSTIAVFGVGAVGLAAVMAARIAGCGTIIAVDRHHSRLDLALQVGATHVVAAGDQDVVQEVRSLCDGGTEFAIDTTGNPGVVRQAVDSLRVAGVFGLIGSAKFGTEVALDLTHMLFGRIFRGIILGDSTPRQLIPQLIEYQQAGLFPIEKLITYYPLDDIEEAVAASERGHAVKPVLLM